VKLLFDQNLSPRLAQALGDLYPGSIHVQDLHLDRAPDDLLWDVALRESFVIVTRDADFADRSLLAGRLPKVVWVRVGNCTTGQIEALLRKHTTALAALDRQFETAVLVIRQT
jgi:predicted nuclease of predicted toxin-antitoxin system